MSVYVRRQHVAFNKWFRADDSAQEDASAALVRKRLGCNLCQGARDFVFELLRDLVLKAPEFPRPCDQIVSAVTQLILDGIKEPKWVDDHNVLLDRHWSGDLI